MPALAPPTKKPLRKQPRIRSGLLAEERAGDCRPRPGVKEQRHRPELVTGKSVREHKFRECDPRFVAIENYTGLATVGSSRRDYNTVRPHSRIGWLTPAAYAEQLSMQRGQGAALSTGSAPWSLATRQTKQFNRQTLVQTG
jgi:hypothetical protein